ncbi:unnamed protein product [Phyllotreta striolata]|uniref:Mab-21-like HhH/H2TH-like domain-containing protein n=1 Tax=Phyllotreta striolata TaxID=444603 RepID=A0A9N9XS42_PHYSR|nr:unnamed protein product [Phyllotreta striolata]
MGVRHSKAAPQEVESALARHLRGESDNRAVNGANEDSISAADRQYINDIKRDFNETPDVFVLNNMLMGIMFFENYAQQREDLKRDLLKKSGKYVIPDVILEKVGQNVIYRPHHGPQKDSSVPLAARRVFALSDEVRVVGSMEEVEEDDDRTVVRIEESQKKGYVRLRSINTNQRPDAEGQSPIPQLSQQESISRSSEESSDTNYYKELQDLKTPKPIEILRGLEKRDRLLDTCLSYRKVKKISWDADDTLGEDIQENDLYQIVAYVNTKGFKKRYKNDVFMNEVAADLDFGRVGNVNVTNEKIFCTVEESSRTVPYEIMPCIKANWPVEQTLKFIMKGKRTAEPRKRYVFPTNKMIDDIQSMECVLLPKGHLKKKGDKKDFDIEWELCFPQAQRYLETFMSHAQIKCMLVLLTLHKMYVEPKTTFLGLQTDHIRNFMLWECESNYADWPEHRLGTKLLQLIRNLNDHLSKARPKISDFFVNDKNTLGDVSIPKIRKAQEAFDEILQSPLMHLMRALRSLRYASGRTFFQPFKFKELHRILTGSALAATNAQMVNPRRLRGPEPESNYFEQFKDGKKRQAIFKQRQEEERKKAEKKINDERRGSVDSIDLNWDFGKTLDIYKRRLILMFFIETFLEIAEKCLPVSSKTATFYIKQAFYLTRILKDESPSFAQDVLKYLGDIEELQGRLGEMETNRKLANGTLTNVKFIEEVRKTNGKTEFEKKKAPRKSVMFVEDHRE